MVALDLPLCCLRKGCANKLLIVVVLSLGFLNGKIFNYSTVNLRRYKQTPGYKSSKNPF